jgi:hypothetical protein
MDMKIIRCLWGKNNHQFFEKNLNSYLDECLRAKEIDDKYNLNNQLVIVWDRNNCEFLEKLGYPYHYMGESLEMNIEFNFFHKILALEYAMETYDEILFLDWDCEIQKPLDENFYNLLRNKNDIQIPLYFYPNQILKEYQTVSPFVDNGQHYYNMFFYQMLYRGKWKFSDGLVIPNAGFIYCRNKEFFKELIKIQREYGIVSNIEEICAMIYFNKFINTTDEYLNKIEPVVCLGKDDLEMKEKQIILNRYSIDKLNKDIYFIHE